MLVGVVASYGFERIVSGASLSVLLLMVVVVAEPGLLTVGSDTNAGSGKVSSLYQLGLQLIVQPCVYLEPIWRDMGGMRIGALSRPRHYLDIL
jgi:hypothetical protein